MQENGSLIITKGRLKTCPLYLKKSKWKKKKYSKQVKNVYKKFIIMMVISFIIMYIIMFFNIIEIQHYHT